MRQEHPNHWFDVIEYYFMLAIGETSDDDRWPPATPRYPCRDSSWVSSNATHLKGSSHWRSNGSHSQPAGYIPRDHWPVYTPGSQNLNIRPEWIPATKTTDTELRPSPMASNEEEFKTPSDMYKLGARFNPEEHADNPGDPWLDDILVKNYG